MARIELDGLCKRFGDVEVLREVSFTVSDGEFFAILGPSGCGKSTLLRIIAGLEGLDAGAVLIDGRDVTDETPSRRNVAMVFQSYALYPHMTVAQNIAVPLEMRRLSALQRLPVIGRILPGTRARRRQIDAEVQRVASALGLDGLLARRPAQLSGGQRQRVALARAMVRDPVAFLMDEPLSNLDARLRAEARGEILALQRRLGATLVFVTHDQAEAMAMADRIAVMHAGKILQVAPPQELYEEPASLAVARFIGEPPINLLPAAIDEAGDVRIGSVRLPFRTRAARGTAFLGVRPESFTPASEGGLRARLDRVEFLGSEAILHAAVDACREAVVLRLDPAEARRLRLGEALHLRIRRALLFADDGSRLPLSVRSEEPVDG